MVTGSGIVNGSLTTHHVTVTPHIMIIVLSTSLVPLLIVLSTSLDQLQIIMLRTSLGQLSMILSTILDQLQVIMRRTSFDRIIVLRTGLDQLIILLEMMATICGVSECHLWEE